MTKSRKNLKKVEFLNQTNVNKGYTMENLVFMSVSLIFGILFIWYAHHNESYKKTTSIQGVETAKKKFRAIKLCGYLLIIGAGVFGIFIIFDV